MIVLYLIAGWLALSLIAAFAVAFLTRLTQRGYDRGYADAMEDTHHQVEHMATTARAVILKASNEIESMGDETKRIIGSFDPAQAAIYEVQRRVAPWQ